VSELFDSDEIDDADYPDPADDDEDTVPCPSCGAEIFDDAPQCPICGEYVTHATTMTLHPIWRWTAIAILAVVAWYFLFVVLGA
jgi:hypothetical protein